MKKAFIIILVSALFSCEKENTNEIKSFDSFSITYSKKSAWVNYTFDAFIIKDSMYIKENAGLNGTYKEIKFKLKDQDISSIRENLNSLIHINLANYYGFGDNIPTDLPVKIFSYQTINKSDHTSIMFPTEHELPEPLDSLIIIINRIIINNSEK